MRPSSLRLITQRCIPSASTSTSRAILILPRVSRAPNHPITPNQPRNISTSPPLLKKAKAAKARTRHREEAEEEEVDGPNDEITEDKLPGVLSKAEMKMGKAVEWARAQVYEGVERGRGRVSPCEW
jgi:ribosome recycling factor